MNVAKVMLLIDADNVSVDIVEQAVEHLLAEHGALHVRRAYCNAETALKHQALYKRLWIRPMVNLAAGKNCTDIALAIDALDLVVAERPEVVVIASSDSDFAPLVARLREKGCRVCGIGQQGKTSDDTERVYDSFLQLAPRGAAAKRTRRSASAKTAAPAAAPAAEPAAPPAAKARRARKSVAATSAAANTATAEAAAAAPGRAEAAVKSRARSRHDSSATTPIEAAAKPRARRTRSALNPPSPPAPSSPAPPPPPAPPPAVAELLRALPELSRGETLDLQKAAEVLRRSGLLSRSSSAPKLFGKHPDWFTLKPPGEPRQVAARQPPGGWTT